MDLVQVPDSNGNKVDNVLIWEDRFKSWFKLSPGFNIDLIPKYYIDVMMVLDSHPNLAIPLGKPRCQ